MAAAYPIVTIQCNMHDGGIHIFLSGLRGAIGESICRVTTQRSGSLSLTAYK